ncbi:MAG: glycosyltransferase family 2 protein [Acidobacteriota bacterium]|nr:glycosyltransferase family 2 protein [Acidobacteriota bacterium]
MIIAEEPAPVRPPGRMNLEDVLAVVVSYNGFEKTRQTADALRRQVGHVHIVDNGSNAESLDVLASLEREPRITVERLGENRGVGCALNRGVQRARQIGCTWLLTMDQDSVVDGSLIEAYRAAVDEDPSRVCLTPRITTNSSGKGVVGGATTYAITSGNLVRVSLFDEIGLYDEGFFVDYIDFDFCLRLRRAGYAVHRVPAALMQHELGDSLDLPRVARRYYALHSPVRRYYMYRNFLYMAERYFLEFPGFVLKSVIALTLRLFFIGFLDPDPLASYRAIARGVVDYTARKHGPYVERAR